MKHIKYIININIAVLLYDLHKLGTVLEIKIKVKATVCRIYVILVIHVCHVVDKCDNPNCIFFIFSHCHCLCALSAVVCVRRYCQILHKGELRVCV